MERKKTNHQTRTKRCLKPTKRKKKSVLFKIITVILLVSHHGMVKSTANPTSSNDPYTVLVTLALPTRDISVPKPDAIAEYFEKVKIPGCQWGFTSSAGDYLFGVVLKPYNTVFPFFRVFNMPSGTILADLKLSDDLVSRPLLLEHYTDTSQPDYINHFIIGMEIGDILVYSFDNTQRNIKRLSFGGDAIYKTFDFEVIKINETILVMSNFENGELKTWDLEEAHDSIAPDGETKIVENPTAQGYYYLQDQDATPCSAKQIIGANNGGLLAEVKITSDLTAFNRFICYYATIPEGQGGADSEVIRIPATSCTTVKFLDDSIEIKTIPGKDYLAIYDKDRREIFYWNYLTNELINKVVPRPDENAKNSDFLPRADSVDLLYFIYGEESVRIFRPTLTIDYVFLEIPNRRFLHLCPLPNKLGTLNDQFGVISYKELGEEFFFEFYTLQKSQCHVSCPHLCKGSSNTDCIMCIAPKLIDNNGECVEGCSVGNYPIYNDQNINEACFPCSSTCTDCITQFECTACTSPLFLDDQTNKCVQVCPTGQYGHTGTSSCQDCNCKVCFGGNPNVCGVCFDHHVLDGFSCLETCPKGKFKKKKNGVFICADCHATCTECTGSKSKCSECSPWPTRYYLNGNTCQVSCPQGTVGLSNGVCESCSGDCKTCVDTQSNCTSCKGELYYNSGSCYSECPLHYFKKEDTKTCEHCETPRVLDNGKCLLSCESTNYFVDLNLYCQSCDDSCKTCDGATHTNCLSCPVNKHLHNNECVSECPVGYSSKNSICIHCHSECLTCTEENDREKCVTCRPGTPLPIKFPISDSESTTYECVASCPLTDYYLETTQKECVACHSSCSKCSGTSNTQCSVCKNSTQKLQAGECVDQCSTTGYYQSAENCLPCDSSCNSCIGSASTHCTTCKSLNESFHNGECMADCPVGYYSHSGQCTACYLTCKTCFFGSKSSCESCASTLVLQDSTCRDSCSEDRYLEGGVCKSCNDSCKTCLGFNSNNCLSCPQGKVLSPEKICQDDCSDRTFLQVHGNGDKECKACHHTCYNCTGPNNHQCISCPFQTYLEDGKCVASCSSSKYLADKTCVDCDSTCLTCFGNESWNCDTCETPKLKQLKSCVDTCSSGYFQQNQSCLVCCPDCLTCDGGSADDCLSCHPNFFLLNKQCLSDCPPKYYKGNGVCEPCNPLCLKCTGPASSECTECLNSFMIFQKNTCVASCPSDHYLESSNTYCVPCAESCETCSGSTPAQCSSCSGTTALYNNACINQCPEGFYSLNNECKPCHSLCKTCSSGNLETQCDSCIESRTLHEGECISECLTTFYEENNICKKCYGTCLECSGPGVSQCDLCGLNKVLHNGRCKNKCPDRFYNVMGNCESCFTDCKTCIGADNNQCTSCRLDALKIKNGVCVENCGVKFYDNGESTCLGCDSSCLNCSGELPSNCTECPASTYLSNGSCVSVCEVFHQDDVCVDQCDTEKYQESTFCVDSCPSGKLTKGKICVETCSSGYYISGDLCHQCHETCKECSGGSHESQCTECKVELWNQGGQLCVEKCQDGWYEYDTPSKTCKRCQGCKTCWSQPTICLTCSSPKLISKEQCLDTCPSKTFKIGVQCKDCHTSCSSCSGSSAQDCLACEDSNLVLQQGTCLEKCSSDFYKDGPDCHSCHVECGSCSGENSNQCNSCPEGMKLEGSKCVKNCSPDHFPEVDLCKICDPNCYRCNGPSEAECLECESPKLKLGSTCVSLCPGKYFALPPNCEKCHATCGDCDNSGENNCSTCLAPKLFHSGTCLDSCPSKFYKSGITCLNCSPDCKDCNLDAASCTSCETPKVLKEKKCVEECGNYFYLGANNTCIKCSPSCKTCDGPTSENCTSCPSNTLKQDSTCIGSCSNGYYLLEEKKECHSCDTNCLLCDGPSASDCTKCKTTKLLQEGECLENCSDTHYLGSNNKECFKCNTGCKSCSGGLSTNCNSCKPPLLLEDAVCIDSCPNGTYQNSDATECLDCDATCLTCNLSQSSCQSCESSQLLQDNTCVDSCSVGYYQDDQECPPCNDTCGSCIGPNHDQCTGCVSGQRVLQGTTCLNSCLSGFIKVNDVCEKCHDTCLTCIGVEIDKCNGCGPDFVLKNGFCVNECGEDYFEIEKKCIACHETCSGCSGSTDSSCTGCPSSKKLLNWSCVESCPASGYFELDSVCKECEETCKTCSDSNSTNCLSCYLAQVLYEGECLDSCPQQTYINNDSTLCHDCDSNCATCRLEPTNCLSCPIDQFLEEGECKPECSPKFYISDRNCFKCHPTCQSCIGPGSNQCTNCLEELLRQDEICVESCSSSHFFNGTDCLSCDPNCNGCSENASNCLNCGINLILDSTTNTCVESCPIRTYQSNLLESKCATCSSATCELCHSTCLTCSDKNINDCESCPEGQVLKEHWVDEVLKGSVCVEECPYHYFTDDSTSLCRLCDSTCGDCESLFSSGCVSCSLPTEVLEDGVCKESCSLSYFQKDEDCTHCHEDCRTCDEKTHKDCLSCPPETHLHNNECLSLCPTGYYPDNNECLLCNSECTTCDGGTNNDCTSCPVEKLLQEGICTGTCSIKFYLSENEKDCEPCHEKCTSCGTGPTEDSMNCSICIDPLYWKEDGNCIDVCSIEGFYTEMSETMGEIESYDKKCLPCHSTCKSCFGNSEDKCNSCPDDRVKDGTTCVKGCPEAKFQLAAECFPCHYSCSTCNGDSGSHCLGCPGATFKQNGGCVSSCSAGYYQSGLECLNCKPSCKTCESGSTCSTCGEPKPYLMNGECYTNCPARHFVSEGVCAECHSLCSSCFGVSSNQCYECYNSNKIHQTSECVENCPSGYFLLNVQRLCPKCHDSCKECEGHQKTNCTECKLDSEYLHKGQCVSECPSGTYINGVYCIDCDSNCFTCSGSSESECLSCKGSGVLNDGECIKACNDGFYENDEKICQVCNTSCVTCSGGTADSCLTCRDNYVRNGTTCILDGCPLGYFEADKICYQCTYQKCQSCDDKECLGCEDDTFLEKGVCVDKCSDNFFSTNTNNCKPCQADCFKCDNEDTCSECASPRPYFVDGRCVDGCSPGFYLKNGANCEPCNVDSCAKCSVALSNPQPVCFECMDGTYLEGENCVEECSSGFYPDTTQKKCLECHSFCTKCFGNLKSECEACVYPMVLQETTCQNYCGDGFFTNRTGPDVDLQVCTPCSPICKTCDIDFDNCTTCKVNWLYRPGTCVDLCGDYFYPIDPKTCRSCHYTCKRCSGPSREQCTQCPVDFPYLQKPDPLQPTGICIKSCPRPTHYVSSNNHCLPCDKSCLTCDGFGCLTCHPEELKVLNDHQCIDECPADRIKVQDTSTQFHCAFCPQSCSVCNQRQNCVQCQGSLYLYGNRNCVTSCPSHTLPNILNGIAQCLTCPSQCLTCNDDGTCKTCRVTHNGQCVYQCPSGYYEIPSTRTCGNCDPTCLYCYGPGDDKCKSCDSSKGLSLYGSTCVVCPAGFYKLGNNKCAQCNALCGECEDTSINCTKCSWFAFILDEKCVGECPVGTYPHPHTKTCQPCSDYCEHCAGPNTCFKCNGNCILEGGSCAFPIAIVDFTFIQVPAPERPWDIALKLVILEKDGFVLPEIEYNYFPENAEPREMFWVRSEPIEDKEQDQFEAETRLETSSGTKEIILYFNIPQLYEDLLVKTTKITVEVESMKEVLKRLINIKPYYAIAEDALPQTIEVDIEKYLYQTGYIEGTLSIVTRHSQQTTIAIAFLAQIISMGSSGISIQFCQAIDFMKRFKFIDIYLGDKLEGEIDSIGVKATDPPNRRLLVDGTYFKKEEVPYLKAIFYFISWVFKVLAFFFVKKMIKNKKENLLQLYFVEYQKKLHFVIFGIVSPDIIFYSYRLCFGNKLQSTELVLKLFAFPFVVFVGLDIFELLLNFCKVAIKKKNKVAAMPPGMKKVNSNDTSTDQIMGTERMIFDDPKTQLNTFESDEEYNLSDEPPKRKKIDFEKTILIAKRNYVIREFLIGEIKNKDNVDKSSTVSLFGNLLVVIRLIMYQIFLACLQEYPKTLTTLMFVIETIYLIVSIVSFCKFKKFMSKLFFIAKVSQSFFILAYFSILTVLAYKNGKEKGEVSNKIQSIGMKVVVMMIITEILFTLLKLLFILFSFFRRTQHRKFIIYQTDEDDHRTEEKDQKDNLKKELENIVEENDEDQEDREEEEEEKSPEESTDKGSQRSMSIMSRPRKDMKVIKRKPLIPSSSRKGLKTASPFRSQQSIPEDDIQENQEVRALIVIEDK